MRCEVLPDWFTFTIRGVAPQSVISDVLGMDPSLFQKLPYSWNGYQTVVEFQNIRVASDGREDDNFSNMGVCVSMSGHGCRTFETMSHLGTSRQEGGFSENFMKLFQYLDKRLGFDGEKTVNITTLDMAADDRDGLLNRNDIIDSYMEESIRTRATSWTLLLGRKCRIKGGFTLYIGSRSSEIFTKIYDKEAEMRQNKLVETGHWIRVEIRFRRKNAESFIHHLVSGQPVGQLFAETLNDKFQFINMDDSNITRCSVCEWWQNFVDEVQKVRLVVRRAVQHSVTQIEMWVTNQISPSLYILSKTIGLVRLKELIDGAAERVSNDSKKEAIINDYLAREKVKQEELKQTEVYKARVSHLKFDSEQEAEEWKQARDFVTKYNSCTCWRSRDAMNAANLARKLLPRVHSKVLTLWQEDRENYQQCVPAFSAEPITVFGV